MVDGVKPDLIKWFDSRPVFMLSTNVGIAPITKNKRCFKKEHT